MWRVFPASASFRDRTIALTIAIAVTRTNGIAVLVIVGPDAEAQDRVDHHRGDEREDRDANRDHEPEDEVDAACLARGVLRQPCGNERNGGGDTASDHSDSQERDDGAPAHPLRSL